MEIIIIVLALGFALFKIATSSRQDNSIQKPVPDAEGRVVEDGDRSNIDYSKAYQRKYLFSLNEKSEFRKLMAWASVHDYYVFPKVRLLDLIEPRKGQENFKGALWKIQAKHVDFVICDHECRIKFIIELDDNSHDKKNRAERDRFVDQALEGVGYTVRHTRGISEEFLESLVGLKDFDVRKGEI